ncbi:MAG: HAD hydrolase-like protein [Desulfobacterales bacterium]|jgi:phosphoglycolate phosphatase-like HAD superfamily hydrolase
MKHLKVIAFDCDGVMFDTTKANMAYYNHLLNYFGKPSMTAEQFAYSHTHTLDESLSFLFDDQKLLDEVRAYRRTMNYAPFIKIMEIEPHLKPLLIKLQPKYKTAIATNRTDSISSVLREHGLEQSFDLVITSVDVEHPKPFPDQLNKLLAYFKLEPWQGLYVGDSELDQKAARAAGVTFVAYRNPTLSAEYYIESLKQLEPILENP